MDNKNQNNNDKQQSNSKDNNLAGTSSSPTKKKKTMDNLDDENNESSFEKRNKEYIAKVREINSDNFQSSKAFAYGIIDDMHKLVDNNKIDYFQIDSSFDAGTKLYSTRVDQILESSKDLIAKIKKYEDDYLRSKQDQMNDNQPNKINDN